MTELSPAARAVLTAFDQEIRCDRLALAAALRAAAELELQQPWPTSIEGCGARWMRDQLLAIADELES